MHKVGYRAQRRSHQQHVTPIAQPPPLLGTDAAGTSLGTPGGGISVAAAAAAGPSIADLWAFPCLILGEFGQAAANEAQFIAEWANCGPVAYLATSHGDPLANLATPRTASIIQHSSPAVHAAPPPLAGVLGPLGAVSPERPPSAPLPSQTQPSSFTGPQPSFAIAAAIALPQSVFAAGIVGSLGNSAGSMAGLNNLNMSQIMSGSTHAAPGAQSAPSALASVKAANEPSPVSIRTTPFHGPAALSGIAVPNMSMTMAASMNGPVPVTPLVLPHVTVAEKITTVSRLAPALQSHCKELLDRLGGTTENQVALMPVKVESRDTAVAVGSISFKLGDVYARGGSVSTGRTFELAVVCRDYDMLVASWSRIRPLLDVLRTRLQKAAEKAGLRDDAKVDSRALTQHRSQHSQRLRPLRQLLDGVADFDDIMRKASTVILSRLPLGPAQRQALVRNAASLRPDHVGFTIGSVAGSSAMVPTLVMGGAGDPSGVNSKMLAQLARSSDTPRRPPTASSIPLTGGSGGPNSAPDSTKTMPPPSGPPPRKGGLFPDTPVNGGPGSLPTGAGSSSGAANIITATSGSGSRTPRQDTMPTSFPGCAVLAAWLQATYQCCRATYEDNVLLPLTMLLCNDGLLAEESIGVVPANGASLADVWRFQRAAESVFGRISWHNPPALGFVGAAAANPIPNAPPTRGAAPVIVVIVDGHNDATRHPTIALERTTGPLGDPLAACCFARLMAQRCMFDSFASVQEAEECLRCDAEAARCSGAIYAASLLTRAVTVRAQKAQLSTPLSPLRPQTNGANRTSTPPRPRSMSLIDRIKAAIGSTAKKEAEEAKQREAAQIQRQMALYDSAVDAAMRASLSDMMNQFRETSLFRTRDDPRECIHCRGTCPPAAALASALQHVTMTSLVDEEPDLAALRIAGVPLDVDVGEPAISQATLLTNHLVALAVARHLQR